MVEVLFTDEFEAWWNELSMEEQVRLNATIMLLEAQGVDLGFPHSSKVLGSRYSHMRELRIQYEGRPYRILYAFDPRRDALLLIGGDKRGNDRWYEIFVPVADCWRKGNVAKARNFKELQAKMPPEARARSEAKAREMLANMALDQLRAARNLTQEHLAALLGIKQASISKMERRTDMYIGTLSRFIEAMGGQLEIRACFPDGSVRITQFSDAAKESSHPDRSS